MNSRVKKCLSIDYRSLISASLLTIGVDSERVSLIEAGAELYGERGLIDSAHLVSLMAALEERLDSIADTPIDLFAQQDTLLEAFRTTNTLMFFLEQLVQDAIDEG
jgi:hypothetical protein